MQYGFPSFGIPSFGLPSFGIPETPSESSGLQSETIIYFEYEIIGFVSPITPHLYKYVSDQYGLVYQAILFCKNGFNGAASYIAQIDNPDAKIDLLKPIRTTARELDQNKMTANLYPAVTSINNHVTRRYNVSDINDWLSSNSIKVVREWAELCEQTGTTIEEENIV
jgi:hypothetical protein